MGDPPAAPAAPPAAAAAAGSGSWASAARAAAADLGPVAAGTVAPAAAPAPQQRSGKATRRPEQRMGEVRRWRLKQRRKRGWEGRRREEGAPAAGHGCRRRLG